MGRTIESEVDSRSTGRIVVAEDDRFYRQILAKRLQAAGHDVVLTENGEEAWEAIQQQPPEVVITDWMMPRMGGFELCRLIKAEPSLRSVYCVLLTAKDRIEDKVSALDEGADDYLLKPCDDGELLARVRTGLRVHRLHARLEQVSITDSLTGLRNRRYFDRRLVEEVSRARRYLTPLCLVMLDLDRFKEINDSYGHLVGDRVLKAVGTFLKSDVRTSEVAARYGGDEFTILLPNTPAEGGAQFVERVERGLAKLRIEGLPHPIGASVGYASLEPGDEEATLLKAADEALYECKRSRRRTDVVRG